MTTVPRAGLLYDPLLLVLATQLDDLETTRIATSNRLYQLTNNQPDKDEKFRGLGYAEDHPDVLKVSVVKDQIIAVEKLAISQLEKHMAGTIWANWQENSHGVGEKTLARLLAATGDPYWNTLYQRPRTVSELWRYCGYDVVDGQSRKRRKGEQAKWSFEARKRGRVVASSVEKQSYGKYREVYNERRKVDEDAVHLYRCPQCVHGGKASEPGTPLKKGHQQARALRAVAKTVLQDLWIEARGYYAERGLAAD